MRGVLDQDFSYACCDAGGAPSRLLRGSLFMPRRVCARCAGLLAYLLPGKEDQVGVKRLEAREKRLEREERGGSAANEGRIPPRKMTTLLQGQVVACLVCTIRTGNIEAAKETQ